MHIIQNFDKSSSLNPRKVFVVEKKIYIPEQPETFLNINEKNCYEFFFCVVFCCRGFDFFFLIYFGSIAKIIKVYNYQIWDQNTHKKRIVVPLLPDWEKDMTERNFSIHVVYVICVD